VTQKSHIHYRHHNCCINMREGRVASSLVDIHVIQTSCLIAYIGKIHSPEEPPEKTFGARGQHASKATPRQYRMNNFTWDNTVTRMRKLNVREVRTSIRSEKPTGRRITALRPVRLALYQISTCESNFYYASHKPVGIELCVH